MASRLLSRRTLYKPNFQALVKHFRAFSSYSDGPVADNNTIYDDSSSESFIVWPDHHLGPFSPQDKRFPFPGRIGAVGKQQKKTVGESVDPETLFKTLPVERHGEILDQALQVTANFEEQFLDSTSPTPSDLLECVAHECPDLMRKDFADLFPDRDIMFGDFTIITISQKTKEDMTGWSEDVEVEREELLKTFVEGANEICDALREAGFWADFIDPSCGKPYLGPHTNATLFETDERYRRLGFEIDDLGCCKVIRHHLWGTHSYIGCIFTNAPTTDPLVKTMIKS